MSIRNDEAMQRWVRELAIDGALARRSHSGSTVRTNADGELFYLRREGSRSVAWGPVTLAIFAPESRTIVLNGDGFTDWHATNAQTMLRRIVQDETRLAGTVARHVIVPFMALTGGEIDARSIRPIDVTRDRWEELWHAVPEPPTIEEMNETPLDRPNANQRIFTATRDGIQFRRTKNKRTTYMDKRTGNVSGYRPYGAADADVEVREEWIDSTRLEAMVAGVRAPRQWTQITERIIDGQPVSQLGWQERIHHLGASVFSGIGEDGRRHKFVSAFDINEPTPLYFLAQLPDRAKVATYDEALNALAPPIVHKAWADGIAVYRQGDVFAIETTLTDEDVYGLARTRVRRDVAMFAWNDAAFLAVHRGQMEFPRARPGEVMAREWCPCGCGHKREVPFGPRAQRAVQIYGTAHTATEVVTTKKGVTYVRGSLFHDPQLDDVNRQRPDHQPIQLGDGRTWHLMVRNQVPRRSRTTRDSTTPTEEREEVTTT